MEPKKWSDLSRDEKAIGVGFYVSLLAFFVWIALPSEKKSDSENRTVAAQVPAPAPTPTETEDERVGREIFEEMSQAIKGQPVKFEHSPPFRFYVVYPKRQYSVSRVENDLRLLLKNLVDRMIEKGVNPHERRLMPTFRAISREKGVTGSGVVVLYMTAHYDWTNDQIKTEVAHED